ncbi:sensor histidine kinase [Streptosporangium roseum]|uniref:Oxygen sensor histidine kinase NreB n=1 Tax=Streptosporangium roseum (strain ATCC 12428 / DSM 43021 / JCM 3005 / KCTC 9067 / NCIMB 10171 / NRRL 2505 / NI 9100) TaxID=479432 RepID=D2ARZ7_STRRD|nr:sensor histidine kinase [Streptosporangium roseum]ACZ84676.1 Histidine kinase [Streptosporangium roseum DSM 43021]
MRALIWSGRSIDPSGPHVWHSLRGWEVLLAVATLVPVAFIVPGDLPVTEKILFAGLMAAILPVYFLFGRSAILTEDRRRGAVYLAVLVVLFTPAAFIEPSAAFALFGLCPQCFMVFPAKPAVGVVIVLNAGPVVRFLVENQGDTFNFLSVSTIVIFFSAVFGIWMERIMRQSEERAALIAELEAQRAEVSRLSAERGALAERERLAGEIHDTLAQGFTSIIMLIQAAEAQSDPARHLSLAVQTARENLAEARALIAALSPAPLDGSTLDEALVRLAGRLREETGIATAFSLRGESRPLPPPTEVVLLRAAQEALANVRKHAAAGRVEVSASYGPETVALEIRDDGRGFDPAVAEGYGLRGMRARVEQVGGTLTLTSSPAGGTTLEAVLPAEQPDRGA